LIKIDKKRLIKIDKKRLIKIDKKRLIKIDKRDNEKLQPERTEENRLIEYISKLLTLFFLSC